MSFTNQALAATAFWMYYVPMKKSSVALTFSGIGLLLGVSLGLLVCSWPAKPLRIRSASELKQVGLQFRGGHNDLSAGVEQLEKTAR